MLKGFVSVDCHAGFVLRDCKSLLSCNSSLRVRIVAELEAVAERKAVVQCQAVAATVIRRKGLLVLEWA
jgi:hypothetical protein